MQTTFIISAGIAVVAFVVWLTRRESRAKTQKIAAAFVGREPMTPTELYERYFLGMGVTPEIVAGICRVLKEQLGADMSRLRAEDDFSQNLSFFWDFDSMANIEIILALEKYFQINISDLEAERTHTVSELVHLVSAKVGRSDTH